MSLILCDECAKKALEVIDCPASEQIEILKIVISHSDNPVAKMAAEQLIEHLQAEADEENEHKVLGTVDIFESRE